MSRAGGLDPRDPPMGALAAFSIVAMLVTLGVSTIIILSHNHKPDMSTASPDELRDFVTACRMSGGNPVIKEVDVSKQDRAPIKSVRWAVRCDR